MASCACGCNQFMPATDSRGRLKTYIFGHGNRGRKFTTLKHDKQFSKGHTPWNKGIHVENAGTFKKGHLGLRGDKAPNWRGGTSLMRNGYIQIRLKGQRKYLHRLIVEEQLGRELKITEQVHHIDHDKLNNSPDNLIVLTPSQHAKYHSNVMWGNLTKGEYHGV